QHHSGQPIALPAGGTSFARGSALLADHATAAAMLVLEAPWRQIATAPALLPAVQPAVDTYASAGQLSLQVDTETTQILLGEVPGAFHAVIHDILLIEFGMAVAEFSGTGRAAPIGVNVESHGRYQE